MQGLSAGDFALPSDEDTPTKPFKVVCDLRVAGHVAGELFGPETHVGFRHRGHSATLMTVPKAAVYEQRDPVLRKQDVRPARQAGTAQTVS